MPIKIRYEDRNHEPLLAPEERVKTFREYALGYSVSLALDEAKDVCYARMRTRGV